MGKAATTFYKRLVSFLSDKRDENYSHTLGWLRCRLSFALLRASIMCIRGAHSSMNRLILDSLIDLQVADSRMCWSNKIHYCINFFFSLSYSLTVLDISPFACLPSLLSMSKKRPDALGLWSPFAKKILTEIASKTIIFNNLHTAEAPKYLIQ